jgi:L-rhamnose mutarotase
MQLHAGCAAEYKKRHDAIWPELAALLKSAGISEYSIFLEEDTGSLFAVLDTAGEEQQDLSRHPVMQKWWSYMADIMDTHADHSPVSKPLKEVFYLK